MNIYNNRILSDDELVRKVRMAAKIYKQYIEQDVQIYLLNLHYIFSKIWQKKRGLQVKYYNEKIGKSFDYIVDSK